MIVKIISHLWGPGYSFIAKLDAVNFVAPFSCYADDFSYALRSFEKIFFIFLKEVI